MIMKILSIKQWPHRYCPIEKQEAHDDQMNSPLALRYLLALQPEGCPVAARGPSSWRLAVPAEQPANPAGEGRLQANLCPWAKYHYCVSRPSQEVDKNLLCLENITTAPVG